MMATVATITRPTGALRQRRISERPGVTRVNTRATTAEAMDGLLNASIPTPLVVDQPYILRKFAGRPPSLVVQLHPNHFKFLQQDGTFPYNSPMKVFLAHLKKQTLPHDMLDELYASDVPFYDGCLVVEVQDFRSGQAKKANVTTNVGSTNVSPFSLHNWNEHVTPSSYVPFPEKMQNGTVAVKKDESEPVLGDKANDKENMPAPDQPASASQKKTKASRTFTVVLFPTARSYQEDMSILARTQMSDARLISRILQARGRDTTPGLTHPPTPLASLPSTPLTSKAPSRKLKMVIDETNVHEFEAEVMLRTNPVLCLKPAKDAEESDAILATLAHPLHSDPPPMPKTRKRTVAEVAADEAQAAEEERFMLSFDDRHHAASGHTGAGEGQSTANSLDQPFKRFKTLETIKSHHIELAREKSEADAREILLKRQQAEADAQKRREQEEQSRVLQIQAHKQMQERAKQAQQVQAQAAQAAQAAQVAQAQATQVQAQAQAQAAQLQQQQQQSQAATAARAQQMAAASAVQSSQAMAMSPVVQQPTPHSTSSPKLRTADGSIIPQAGVPMVATASSQGAGSPARPPSAIPPQVGGAGMGRQASHQSVQMGSAHGTPQMANTPHLGANRMMTPVPRPVQHGSPAPAGMQATPMMATASFNGLTPEQQMLQRRNMMMAQQQQQQALQAQAQQQQMQAGQQQMMGQMTPQMQMMMMQRQQSQAMAAGQQQFPQMANAQQAALQRQAQIQQAQQRQQIMQSMQAQQAQQQHQAAAAQQQQQRQQQQQQGQMVNMQNQMAAAAAAAGQQDMDPNSPRAIAIRWRTQQLMICKQTLTARKQQYQLRNPSQQDLARFDQAQRHQLETATHQLNVQTQQKLEEETQKRQMMMQQRQALMQQQAGMMQQAGNPMAQMNANGQMNMNAGQAGQAAYIAQMQAQQRKYAQMQAQQQKLAQIQQIASQPGPGQAQAQAMLAQQQQAAAAQQAAQQQQLLQQMQMNGMNMGNMNMQAMGGGGMTGMPGGQQ